MLENIYLGGVAGGDMPFSGGGYLMEAGGALTLGVNNAGLVRVFASVSGDKVTYVAVQ
jgi:hypothetical protein